MNIFENISAAISSVFSNKMRTFLTMIGIIIGVSSVITITSLGKGFEKTISSTFEVLNSKATQIYTNWKDTTIKDEIVLEDSKKLRHHPNVKYSSGYFSTNIGITLKNPNEEEYVSLMGTEVDFSYMQKNFFQIKYGRVFTQEEDNRKARVCLIDEHMAVKIFGRKNVVGESVNLIINNKDYEFEVIGVTDGEFTTVMGTIISVPIQTAIDIYNADFIHMLYVEFKDTENIKRYENELIRMLAANHNTTDDKYLARSNLEQVETVQKVVNLYTMFIGFVAGISLLVGGIGVMNIMLVTVTERTKEIGIRKALGATNSNIKVQFLIESMFICILGGIVGIIIGYITSTVLGGYLNAFFTVSTGMEMQPPALSMPVAIGAMVVSTIVGVIFGVYPAGKAAKLDPIEALRYE